MEKWLFSGEIRNYSTCPPRQRPCPPPLSATSPPTTPPWLPVGGGRGGPSLWTPSILWFPAEWPRRQRLRRGEICNGARLVQTISACLLTLKVHTPKPDVFAAKKKKTRRQPWKWEKSKILQERASYWRTIMTTIFINDNRCIKLRQHPPLLNENIHIDNSIYYI